MSDANKRQVGGDHYKQFSIQPWDAIQSWGLGFFDGNVVKYIARYRAKGGLDDLKKAQHYIEKLIEQETQLQQRGTSGPTAFEGIHRDFIESVVVRGESKRET